jgi:mercuric ion binding protein
MKKLTFVLMLFVTSLTAWAKPQTVTLDLPTMNCAMCPITVKKALTKVDGVSRAEVSYEDKEAMVTFDDEKTSADALIEATTNAGFPSTIKNKAN